MNLHDLLLTIHCFTTIGVLVEIVIILNTWKRRIHGYLLMSCIATLVNTLGYLLQIQAETQEACVVALKLSYLGRTWLAFFLVLFLAQLAKVKIPGAVKNLLVLINTGVYVVILTLDRHRLYYKEISFETGDVFPRLVHVNGPVHHFTMGMQFFYIVVGMSCLLYALFKEKNSLARKRLMLVLYAIIAQSAFFALQVIGVKGLTEYFDITMLGYFIGTLLMLAAIFKFDLLGTGEVAREFVIDRISEGIIAVDNEGIVRYHNEPARQMYPQIVTDESLLPEEIVSALADGGNIVRGGRIFKPEENALFYEGAQTGKLYALADETEHQAYLEELQKQRDIADRANEAKSRFLANMSHEIRTPMSAVLGMDEMILRESREDTIKSYAQNIMAAGKTLMSIINDILDLSKVEEGRMEIVPVQYEVVTLVNDLINMVADQAAKKGLKFDVNVDGHIPRLLVGDEVRIRQCLLNILTNGVKYTQKGSVTLDVSFEPKDAEHILLKFSVTDTGIGIKEEDMERVLAPYTPLDDEKYRNNGGAGLGMNITRRLLDLMGSSLTVDSKFGEGSVFSFDLLQEIASKDEIGDYAKRFDDIRNENLQYQELLRAPEARILVVDDTEINLTVITNLLKKTGIQIDTAMSGKDSLALAGINDYDVIFIDHMMPDMDGITVLKELRKRDRNSDVPAVALTANAVSGARKTYLDAGFTDYMSKPVEGIRLEQMLLSLLPPEKVKKTLKTRDAASAEPLPEKPPILVVDDDEAVCELIKEILEPLYEIKTSHCGADVAAMAKEYHPALILLDVNLSDKSGFEVMEELKGVRSIADIPVLLATGDDDSVMEENGLKSGAADYIRKPFAPDVLKQRVKRIITLHSYQQSIEKEVARQTSRSKRLTREMMQVLSKTVDTKDHYTDGHSRRVAALCAEIGRRLGKSDDEQVVLYEIGLLHDIGKIGIHEDIIHKNSRLSDDEFAAIKEHTLKGFEILKEIKDMPNLSEGARWHHEHFDGSGYPDGIKGEEIPESARINCVADCYDAMTSTRSYSTPRRQEDVRAEFVRCRGSWFDPRVTDVILAMIDEDTEYRMNESAQPGDVWQNYDRLWGNIAENGEPDPEKGVAVITSGAPLPGWIRKIPDINVQEGLTNCGSEESYLSVLRVFHETAGQKGNEIEALHAAGDIEKYTIMVHALKSSARIIGANELSEAARELEEAGKRGDKDFIEVHTGELLERYREVDAHLARLDEEVIPRADRSDASKPGAELQAISPGELAEAYQTIAEVAGSMDYAVMEELLDSLRGYRLDPRDEEKVRSFREALTRLDWDSISEMALESVKAFNDTAS